MTDGFVISICIPTYNRCEYLECSLSSIVSQECFFKLMQIEVVIQDNCSNDSTQYVGMSYAAQWPLSIKYFRNKTPLSGDANFECCLKNASGLYLKLSNDYLIYKSGALAKLVRYILEYENSKKIIFFSNLDLAKERVRLGSGNIDFLSSVSFQITWIGMFGIWRSHFERVKDFSRCSSLQLTQVDVAYRLLKYSEEFVILDFEFALKNSNSLGVSREYDLITVFLDNYLTILSNHLGKARDAKAALSREKSKVLLNFICGWAARSSMGLEAGFKCQSHWKRVRSHCNANFFLFFYYSAKYFYNVLKLQFYKNTT